MNKFQSIKVAKKRVFPISLISKVLKTKKLVIDKALNNQLNSCTLWMERYQMNKRWNQIKEGFLSQNVQINLKLLSKLEVCQINDDQQKSYYLPFSKKHKIVLCYNKIDNYTQFQKQLTYNLILAYDHSTKEKYNWNNAKQVGTSMVRGLNISGICEKANKQCFEKELNKRLFEQQRFVDEEQIFEQILQNGLNDLSPILNIKFG